MFDKLVDMRSEKDTKMKYCVSLLLDNLHSPLNIMNYNFKFIVRFHRRIKYFIVHK